MPYFVPTVIQMGKITFKAMLLSDFQWINFTVSMTPVNRTFSMDYLRLMFIDVDFTVDPLYQIQVIVNNVNAVT